MGLRFQRRVKLFPGVRLNFSARGISTTIGVRGASINIGPNGTHLNAGLPGTGISYRERLSPPQGTPFRPSLAGGQPTFLPGHQTEVPESEGAAVPRPTLTLPGEIKSGSSDEITSVGLREFRNLLREALDESKRLRDELPTLEAERARAQSRAYKWQNGFLLKRVLRKKYAAILGAYQAASGEVSELEAAIERCRIALEIQMDAGMDDSYGVLVDAFRALAGCERSWDNVAAVAVNQVQERSVATQSIRRVAIHPDCKAADVLAPSRAALHFPNANGGDLFILPGLLLVVKQTSDFALINLTEVRVEFEPTKFLEEETVPADTTTVGETWKKVNKDGSPDRRFTNNFRIPVVLYGTLRFASAAGLKEEYVFSNAEKAKRFSDAFAVHKNAVPLGSA